MNLIMSLPFFAWATKVMLSPSVLAADRRIKAARAAGDIALEQREIYETEAYWGPAIFDHFRGSTLREEGIDRVPEGAVLFVSNHQSYGDIVIFMKECERMKRQIGFVAKDDLVRIPLFGNWIKNVRSLMLERDDARAAVATFRTGEEWLKQGFNLVIFPEGTRSRSNELGEFKKGSLHLATKSGVPIVPVTLWNSWHMFEKYDRPHRTDARIYVHEAIYTEDLSRKEIAELPERVRDTIASKLDEWRKEEI